MQTEQPTNAVIGDTPQARQSDARDPETPAAVMSDDRTDDVPGGGGLKRDDTGDGVPGSEGAATPNSPIDASLPHDGGDAVASHEARTRAAADAATERTAP